MDYADVAFGAVSVTAASRAVPIAAEAVAACATNEAFLKLMFG